MAPFPRPKASAQFIGRQSARAKGRKGTKEAVIDEDGLNVNDANSRRTGIDQASPMAMTAKAVTVANAALNAIAISARIAA